jgi:hypothetical protein
MGPDSCTPDCRHIQRSKARRVASSDGAREVVTSRLETLLQPRATGTPPAMPLSFVCALEFFIYSRAFQPLVSCHHWPASTSPNPPPPAPPFPRPSSFILPEHLRLSTSILTLHSLSAGPAQGSSHHRAAGTECARIEFSPCLHFMLSTHPDHLPPALGCMSPPASIKKRHASPHGS